MGVLNQSRMRFGQTFRPQWEMAIRKVDSALVFRRSCGYRLTDQSAAQSAGSPRGTYSRWPLRVRLVLACRNLHLRPSGGSVRRAERRQSPDLFTLAAARLSRVDLPQLELTRETSFRVF